MTKVGTEVRELYKHINYKDKTRIKILMLNILYYQTTSYYFTIYSSQHADHVKRHVYNLLPLWPILLILLLQKIDNRCKKKS